MAEESIPVLIEIPTPFLSPLMTNGSPGPVTVEGVQVVTDAEGSWSSDTTPDPVARTATVRLRAVAKLKDAPYTYYWGFPQGTVSGIGTVHQWDNLWGTPTIAWMKVMPAMESSSSNDPWNSSYNRYTNVVANDNTNIATCPHGHKYNNPGEGGWLGNALGTCISTCTSCSGGQHTCQWTLPGGYTFNVMRGIRSRHPLADLSNEGQGWDIIEYNQTGVGSGWEITESSSTTEGTRRYRISAFTHNGVTVYSPGKANISNISNLEYKGTDDAYDKGIKNTVTRIVRKSNATSNYIKHIESYRLVPWIYGSTDGQVDNYIGFDCADLVVGAARQAGNSVSYQSAAQLKQNRPTIRGSDEPFYLDGNTIKKRSDGKSANIKIGTDIQIGDLIIFDWYGDGSYTHSAVLYSGSGTLRGSSMFICADHPGVITISLSGLKHSDEDNFVLREGW
jgi:cell wall-associated NlpC family hydrolase